MAAGRDAKFLSFNVDELHRFLRERGVPIGDEKHAELAERAYWADKLGLARKPTDREAESEIEVSKCAKLMFDGGMVRLPRPETLSEGWEAGPASLPDTCRDHLDSYIKAGNRRIGLIKTEGKRTLALGKGLYMSGHIRALQYNGISLNLCYCFVRGKVIPQVKTSEQTYYTWVVLHKETGQVCTAECSCCVGVQATCKHISGLLFAIVEAVEEGRNTSCTSQKQAWGQAPKKGDTIHEPAFAKNIRIVGVKPDVSPQLLESKRIYRSEFEPRITDHRSQKPVSKFNLDALASITNGNCGLLMYNKAKPDPHHQLPDLNNCKKEEIVETSLKVITVAEAFKNSDGKTNAENILRQLQLNQHQQSVLAKDTSSQAASSLWADQRKGRITASVVGDCVGCVREDGTLSGHSQVARVLGYYGSPRCAALDWGRTQEPVAKKQYIAWHRLHHKHRGVSCEDTGLWVSMECPYVAASPDGIVRCNQCGTGLLEIKNPYTDRLLKINELSTKKGSCLTTENGVTQLRRSHPYYAQVQVQMWCTGYKWSDFVIRTASKSNNIYVERILFDEDYIVGIQPKLYDFFVKGVIAEMSSGAIHKVVMDKSVRKVMDSILGRIEKIIPSPSTEVVYPCGICGEECKNDPSDDGRSSIGCDICTRWFHYSCVGLKGSESFLKKRKSLWKCSACSSQIKGRKRKRQSRAT